MKTAHLLALATTIVVLTGTSAGYAANQMSKTRGDSTSAKASDTLTLTTKEQKSIWKDVSRHAANQSSPSGFVAGDGVAVPSGISTYPLPRKAARDVPMARPYRYAMTEDKLLLVNPSDNKIAEVVTKQ